MRPRKYLIQLKFLIELFRYGQGKRINHSLLKGAHEAPDALVGLGIGERGRILTGAQPASRAAQRLDGDCYRNQVKGLKKVFRQHQATHRARFQGSSRSSIDEQDICSERLCLHYGPLNETIN